jgi:hypothetical protein
MNFSGKQVYENNWYSLWSHSDSAGYFFANFQQWVDLIANTAIILNVDYTDPVTGNFTCIYRALGL